MTTAVTSGGSSQAPMVTLTYGYDHSGYRTSLSDSLSGQGLTTYVYDAAHRLTTLTQSIGGTQGAWVTFSYDPGNRLTSMWRTLGGSGIPTITSIAYDTADRITAITHAYNANPRGQVILATYFYSYDLAGRLTSKTDQGVIYNYTYDNADQLTNVTGGGVETYTYDSGGNRTMSGYSTITGNELSTAPGYTYTYDGEGNQVSKTNTSTHVTTSYTYDYRNRLTQVTVGGTVTATFTYDPLNRRMSADDNGTTTWMVYDGTTAYADFSNSGAVQERYLSIAGQPLGGLLARTDSGGTTSWYLNDSLGSVRNLVDSSSNLLDTLVYDSYGNITTETNATAGDRFKYTGMQLDGAIGLYYDNARWYDSVAGRFVRQDPLGLAAGDANLYCYALNGPVNLRDQTGLKPAVGDGPTGGSVAASSGQALNAPSSASDSGCGGSCSVSLGPVIPPPSNWSISSRLILGFFRLSQPQRLYRCETLTTPNARAHHHELAVPVHKGDSVVHLGRDRNRDHHRRHAGI